jgi:hypothetical protein
LDCENLKMNARRSIETPGSIYLAKGCDITEDLNFLGAAVRASNLVGRSLVASRCGRATGKREIWGRREDFLVLKGLINCSTSIVRK